MHFFSYFKHLIFLHIALMRSHLDSKSYIRLYVASQPHFNTSCICCINFYATIVDK